VPRISIVLATHNQARWLPETITSVRAQTLTDWELLVVDDGSTDDTAEVAARAGADTRIRYLPGARRERAAARNRGIAAAKSNLVAFLDGDDLWHPEKLARQTAALDAAPDAALCYTVARYVDATGARLGIRRPPVLLEGEIFPALMRANRMILASVLVRQSALDEAGAFDERLPAFGCEDWDLWLRIARFFPVVAVRDELTYYRRHAGNTARARVLESGLAVVDKHYADPTTPAVARLSRSAARARLLWYHAGAAVEDRRMTGLGLAARAMAAAPSSLASRPAAGALVTLALPKFVLRALGRLPG